MKTDRKWYMFWLIGIVIIGCGRNTISISRSWNPDTTKLDELARSDPKKWLDLVHTVESFYNSLHHKQWNDAYNFRTTTFKNTVNREVYMSGIKQEEAGWELLNYRVQKVEDFGNNKLKLTIEFLENPGPKHCSVAVWWKKEENTWKCEEAGPLLLPGSQRVTSPEDEN